MNAADVGASHRMGHREFLACDYALLNPMQLESNQWIDLPAAVVMPPGLGVDVAVLPRLVVLRSLSEDRRLELLTRNDEWQRLNRQALFGALLTCDQEHEVVLRHLCNKMMIKMDRAYWIRLHDPRVFSCLDELLTDVQLRRLLGPIRTWAWFEPFSANWMLRERPTQVGGNGALRLDAMQWGALKRLALVNRCLTRIVREDGVLACYRTVATRIDKHLQRAAHIGLIASDDACLYALNLERNGADWLSLPHVRESLESASRGKQTLVRALAERDATAFPQDDDAKNVSRSYPV